MSKKATKLSNNIAIRSQKRKIQALGSRRKNIIYLNGNLSTSKNRLLIAGFGKLKATKNASCEELIPCLPSSNN